MTQQSDLTTKLATLGASGWTVPSSGNTDYAGAASLTNSEVTQTRALVSVGGISDAQAISGSLAGTVIGEVRTLSDGTNVGVRVRWAVPSGASAAAWCWDIYPPAAYQG